MKRVIFAVAVALTALHAPSAAAQTTTVESTPVVIHATETLTEGLVAERTQIIHRQRVTTIRAAALDEAIARPSGRGRQREGFPAGEKLFGIYDGVDSWAYCGLREGFFGDSLTCYQDQDGDGRFDQARPSGAPFLGVPLFVFTRQDERPLAVEATYRRIPYSDGPSIEAGFQLALTEPRTRRGETTNGYIDLNFGYIVGDRFVPVQGTSTRHTVSDGAPAILELRGARVEISGPALRGQLRYRVLEAMPAQINRVTMTQTVTYGTGYTYVPIYIPR